MLKKLIEKIVIIVGLLVILIVCIPESYACTGLVITSEDNKPIKARTMEFTSAIDFNIILVPKGTKYTGQLANGSLGGMTWEAKYGFAGFNPVIEKKAYNTVLEGLNDQGLAVGGFFFPHGGRFQTPDSSQSAQTISSAQVVPWILSNCATVQDVINKLPKIFVCKGQLPHQKMTLHWQVADKEGNVIVIEYTKPSESTDGKRLHIYNCSKNEKYEHYKVITNDPAFPKQVEALEYYKAQDLSPWSKIGLFGLPKKIDFFGEMRWPLGQGSGLYGLPGNFVPEQRFVQVFYFLQCIVNPHWGKTFTGKNSKETMKVAFHILNQFDLVMGFVRENPDNPSYDITHWTSAMDLANQILYYNTYSDRTIQKIDLKQALQGINKINTIKTLGQEGEIINQTHNFKKTSSSDLFDIATDSNVKSAGINL